MLVRIPHPPVVLTDIVFVERPPNFVKVVSAVVNVPVHTRTATQIPLKMSCLTSYTHGDDINVMCNTLMECASMALIVRLHDPQY